MVDSLFAIFALVLGVTIHEFAHGLVADRMGDDTPRRQGRLTINPLPHIDPFGSIILPAMLFLLKTGFFFAYAKPVEINPMNFRNPRRGMLYCSLAGPAANLVLALLFALMFRGLLLVFGAGDFADEPARLISLAARLSFMTVMVNLVLALFNLIPIPPLDGSKVLMHFLPLELAMRYARLAPYGFLILILLLNTPVLGWYFNLVLKPALWVLTGIYLS